MFFSIFYFKKENTKYKDGAPPNDKQRNVIFELKQVCYSFKCIHQNNAEYNNQDTQL